MANRIKSISKYSGSAWGTETPIGADAANVDLATSYSATTATDANNATVETAMAAIHTDTTNLKKAGHGNGTVTNYDSTSSETSKVLTTDCVVAASDDTATAWSKFNRFRRRVSNKFADYFLTSNLVTSSTGVTTTGADTTVYTSKAINNYLANVVGYTNSTAPEAGSIKTQLESLNDNVRYGEYGDSSTSYDRFASTPEPEFKKLLWENSDPFNTQVTQMGVTVENSNLYQFYEVYYIVDNVNEGYIKSTRFKNDTRTGGILESVGGTSSTYGGNLCGYLRAIYITETGITIGNAIVMTTSGTIMNNNLCVPYYIYGILF